MELKVWVEGIQRIVCGVTDTTTCQDVVFALAHATGKIGRFTLIERWRNNERLLAPSEQPLKVLTKWGERSNDVQFILQWSPLEPKSTSSSVTKPSSTDPNSSQSQPQSTTSSSSTNNACNGSVVSNGHNTTTTTSRNLLHGQFTSPTTNGLNGELVNWPTDKNYGDNDSMSRKKATTVGTDDTDFSKNYTKSPNLLFSSSNTCSSSSSSAIFHRNGKLVPVSCSNKSYPSHYRVEDESQQSQSQASSLLRKSKDSYSTSSAGAAIAPPPYRDPPNPTSATTTKLLASNNNNIHHQKELPPYREPPPPNLNLSSLQQLQHHQQQQQLHRGGNNQSPVSSLNSFTGSVNSSGNSGSGGSGNFATSGPGLSLGAMNTNGNNGIVSHQRDSSFSKDCFKSPTLDESPSNSISSDNMTDSSSLRKPKDVLVPNGQTSSPILNGLGSNTATASNSNPMYLDLVRLINLQREKLTSQQAELTKYDAEILFWEGKAKEQQKQMDYITKEITRLETISTQHESQMLSLSHIEEENEILNNEAEVLKNELSSLKNEFITCEDELLQCKGKIKALTGEVQSTQVLFVQREDERKQRDAAIKAEIERLREELEIARRDTDAVSELSGSLETEVSSIESELYEKKKQMEQLVNAMKEANLQSLAIQPPESINYDDGNHFRLGSHRRIVGSPRQLENAAPTSKNPHGVWV